MIFKKFIHRCFFVMLFSIFSCLIGFLLFKPIYLSNSIIIPYSLSHYDICISNPNLWLKIKFYFFVFYIISSLIVSNSLYMLLFKNKSFSKKVHNSHESLNFDSDLTLLVGKNKNDNFVYIPEKSLYQNILVTGTIR